MNISSEQIIADRENRKNAGLTGCITGRPTPDHDFFGYRDVQIWFRDANGNLNGDPSFDRKNPSCFCFDCRGAFDPKGEVDAELVNAGHQNAMYAYRNLLPNLNIEAMNNPSSAANFPSNSAAAGSSLSQGLSNDSPSLT
jgi:hypothetical protein